MRTMMKWKSEQSSQHSTSEDVDPGRQSPLFEDFSDDEDFDCLNDVKPVSREHRVSSGSTSNLPGQRTPNTPPSASPKHGNLLSSPFSTSTSPCLVGVSTSPHLTSVSTASPHPLSLTASPHPLGMPVGSPLESGIKMEAMDIDGECSLPILTTVHSVNWCCLGCQQMISRETARSSPAWLTCVVAREMNCLIQLHSQ